MKDADPAMIALLAVKPCWDWRIWWSLGFRPMLAVLRHLPMSEWRRESIGYRIDVAAMDIHKRAHRGGPMNEARSEGPLTDDRLRAAAWVDEFEMAAIDAHAGWMLWDSTTTDGGEHHAKEWLDCTVAVCVKRRDMLAALATPAPEGIDVERVIESVIEQTVVAINAGDYPQHTGSHSHRRIVAAALAALVAWPQEGGDDAETAEGKDRAG